MKFQTYAFKEMDVPPNMEALKNSETNKRVFINCMFAPFEKDKFFFDVITMVGMENLFNSEVYYKYTWITQFEIRGSKQELKESNYQFFEKLFSIGYSHAQAAFYMKCISIGIDTGIIQEIDFSPYQEFLMQAKNKFVDEVI